MEKVKLPYVPLIWVCSRMDRRNTVFLDSSMRNDLGRRSYLGMVPYNIHTPADSDLIGTLDDIGENTLMGFITYDQGLDMHGFRHHTGGGPCRKGTDSGLQRKGHVVRGGDGSDRGASE